jgi:hypothetical protein
MMLCGTCVADVMNDPYAWLIPGDNQPPNADRFAEVIEMYATEAPERPTIVINGGNRRSRAVTLRAVSTVDGVPLCVWHVAERPWIGRAGR